MKKTFWILAPLVVYLGVAGCATGNKNTSAEKSRSAIPEGASIVGDIPATSPFAKLKLGMSQSQVHDLIGQPTDQTNYSTGKMFIPFYFGSDTMRLEELYKGQGRITFTGVGIGGVNFKVYRVVYDPAEDGYPN